MTWHPHESQISQDYTLPAGLAPQVLFKGVEAHVTLRAARRAGGVFKRPSNPLEGHIFSGKSSSNHVRFYFIGTFPAFFWNQLPNLCFLVLYWILGDGRWFITSENERFNLQQWRLKFEVTKLESVIEAKQLGLKQQRVLLTYCTKNWE
jgi:hypothetical protein